MTTPAVRLTRAALPRDGERRGFRSLDEEAGLAAAELARSPEATVGAAAWVAAALEATLRTLAPGVHASTPLVRQLAGRAGRELALDADARARLDIAVRVRDIGMVALPRSGVLDTTPLSPAEWDLVNQHPAIGAQVLEELSVVAPAAEIVRAHHERWDGGGYPAALQGEAIPLLSRVIATCDAFVAMATDRPHRRGLGAEAALALISQESGVQFDPDTVAALTAALAGDRPPRARRPRQAAAVRAVDPAPSRGPAASRGPSVPADHGELDLTDAVAEFDVVPALAPASERLLAALASDAVVTGDIVKAVENDMGLTVAVLRHAQPTTARRTISNVADAVIALGPAGIAEAVASLPLSEFPWRTSQLEVLMHRSLVHAQAVARATDRIAHELKLDDRDDLIAAALLHDVGKLVLSRALPEYTGTTDRTATPEARIRQERRAWGVDHASLGGMLIRKWGLPLSLAGRVSSHHSAQCENDVATRVRLADMVAHQALGDAVNSRKMLDLAHVCGVSPTALREILFDLPHAGGSHRRRAEPSPLTHRETAALRGLAEGKLYKTVAADLDMSVSTVRTHLHHVYRKLGVGDRALAVLRATEMGWI